jgi:hypothetical protein
MSGGQSKGDYFLAGRTRLIHLEMISNAFLMEEVAAGQVGAHRSRRKLLVTRKTAK